MLEEAVIAAREIKDLDSRVSTLGRFASYFHHIYIVA
jgi:hypothetical protein